MENHIFELVLLGINIVVIIITGLIAFISNDLKATIKDIKCTLKEMVGEPVCKARMDAVERDIHNIGAIARNHSHD